MDVERHVVTVDGQQQTASEGVRAARDVPAQPGRVLTRGQLIDRVWGSDYVGDTKTLDVHVKRLRIRSSGPGRARSTLVTVRGLGLLDL